MIHHLSIGENFVAIPDGAGGFWRGELRACVADAVGMMRRSVQLGAKTPMLIVTGDDDAFQPRKETVRNAVKELQLKARDGDLVIIHQSSHGYTDSFGQALLYYDGLIYEEEIRSWLSKFSAGVKGIFIADACYSGGLSEKGFMQPAIRHAIDLPSLPKEHVKGFFGEPEILSSWAFFGASAADQPSLDGDEYGAWTGALLRCSFRPLDTSAQEWFDAARAVTPGSQTPTLGLLGKNHDWLNQPFSGFA